MYILRVAVFTLCAEFVFGQFTPCLTADGRRKGCIPFVQCELLQTLAKKVERTEEDMHLLHRSFCGTKGIVAYVCCPEPAPVQIFNRTPQCSTPDGFLGQCINLFSCPHLVKLLRPPVPQEAIAYVQNSRCYGFEERSVCCGPPPSTRTTLPPPTTRTTPPSDYEDFFDDVDPVDCKTLMTAFPPDRSSECCGYSVGFGNRIFGGNATGIDEYPWAVIIEYSLQSSTRIALSCGGALISGKYVLTAAHCIAGQILNTGTPRIIRLGEYDILHEGQDCIISSGGGEDCTDGVKRILIDKTIPHPSYIAGRSKRHDIGLIRMRETAPYTEFIRPICLPAKDLTRPENTPPYFSMYAVGWGATENAPRSNVKLDVNVPFVSLEKCQPVYNRIGQNVLLGSGQLCAGGIEAQDACKGDSGGPLVYEKEKKFELIGLVSFGPKTCGNKGVPGIYTNVYEYLDWIKSVIVA